MRVLSGAAVLVFALAAAPIVPTPAWADSAIFEMRSTQAPSARVDAQPAVDPAPTASNPRVRPHRAHRRARIER